MRGLWIRALALFVGGSSVALAQPAARDASADEPLPLELDWKAPSECASEAALRSELSRIAHVKPGRTVSRLSARGRIEKQGDVYRLTLRTERGGEKGERKLSAPECRALEREVTLVLALAFGEGVELVEPEPEPAAPGTDTSTAAPPAGETTAPAEEPASEPEQAVVAPPEPAPSAPPAEQPALPEAASRSRLPLGFFIGGGVLARALPSPSPLLSAGLDAGSARLWLSARLLVLTTVNQSLPRDVTAEYSGAGLALSACTSARAAAFRFGGCAGAAAVGLYGSSQGATESADVRPLWYAATASALAQWPARGIIGLRVEALLGVSLNTPRFVVDGLGEAYTVPRLTPGATLSLVTGLLD